jgi:hypothetical protein
MLSLLKNDQSESLFFDLCPLAGLRRFAADGEYPRDDWFAGIAAELGLPTTATPDQTEQQLEYVLELLTYPRYHLGFLRENAAEPDRSWLVKRGRSVIFSAWHPETTSRLHESLARSDKPAMVEGYYQLFFRRYWDNSTIIVNDRDHVIEILRRELAVARARQSPSIL